MDRDEIEREINELIRAEKIKDLRIFLLNNDPQVRKISVELMSNNQYAIVSQYLCDLLGDPDSSVRESAFKVTWIREKNSNCEHIIDKLKDEIQYGSDTGMLGPAKARGAVKRLVELAPDKKARAGILKHIKENGLQDLVTG